MSENERENERDDGEEEAWLLARERGQPGPIVSDATAARYARLQSMIADLPATPGGAKARAGWQQDVLAAIDATEAGAESSSNQVPVQVPVQPSVQAPVRAPAGAPAEAPVEAPAEAPAEAPVQVPVGSSEGAINQVVVTDAYAGELMPKRRRTRPARRAAASAIFTIAAVVAITLAVRRHGGEVDGATFAYEVEPASSLHRGADPSVGDTLIVRAVVEGPGELRIYDGAGVEQAHCAAPAPDCTIERSGNRTTLRLAMPLRVPGALRAVLFAAPLGGTSGGLSADVEAAMRAGIARTPRDLVEVR